MGECRVFGFVVFVSCGQAIDERVDFAFELFEIVFCWVVFEFFFDDTSHDGDHFVSRGVVFEFFVEFLFKFFL